jgi:hypothetical protein
MGNFGTKIIKIGWAVQKLWPFRWAKSGRFSVFWKNVKKMTFLFCVGGMGCNREVLCGGIIEDSWDGCSPRTELVMMSPITCFSFDETRWYTATDEADLCLVTAVNYDDLFCDYNTLTTVNSVTNTRTIQQTPMFHGCTITNLNIAINKWMCVKLSAFKTFEVTGPHQVFAYY